MANCLGPEGVTGKISVPSRVLSWILSSPACRRLVYDLSLARYRISKGFVSNRTASGQVRRCVGRLTKVTAGVVDRHNSNI